MTSQIQLKESVLFVVQYVPDPVREEKLNIGIFLHCPEEKFLGCLFTEDYKRVKHFHAQADLEFLRELQEYFENQIDEHGDDLDRYLRLMQASFSNLIQLAEPHACAFSDPAAEMAGLFSRYVPGRAASPQPEDSRARIKQKLTAALSHAGVWEKMEKRIPAAPWTHEGDPFTFDYGYKPLQVQGRPNGHVHFIHALSLKSNPDLPKVLVYSMQHVRRKEAAELTAVYDESGGAEDLAAGASRRILEEGGIALQPVRGLASFAQRIRGELMM